MDDGSASFLISLFRCGDLAVVGLDLGLADMGINSFDVCLVVDVSFLISLFRCGDLVVVGLDLGLADMGINSFDVCLVVDGNFVVVFGLGFLRFLYGGEKGFFFKELFLFLFVFSASKHCMEEMRLFLWIFL